MQIILNWIELKITKTHNDIGQTNKYSKKMIKSTDLVYVFATKVCFIMYGKHIA